MTTMAEYEEAVANGDTICQCGYRKSQHGPNDMEGLNDD